MGDKNKRSKVWIYVKIFLVVWFCGKVAGRFFMIPGPWGPKIGGSLPNGHQVYFRSRGVGGETDDQMIWITPDNRIQHLWVDRVHAGFDHVTIKYIDDGTKLWVESDGEVGASLDLASGEFRSENARQLKFARFGDGKTLDQGLTVSFVGVLLPY